MSAVYQKTSNSGPLFARQRNAIRMAFRSWADSDPRLLADLVHVHVATKKHISMVYM